MKKFDMSKITRSLNKVAFKAKKHSPEVLVVAGVVGTVTSTVLACRATLKVNDILEEPKADIKKIHEAKEKLDNGEELKLKDGSIYTEKDNARDLTFAYVKAAGRVIKLYAPSIILGTASITAILASHRILKKRNIALAAAYATIDKSFKEYRGRVVERFGKELDKELRFNIKSKEFETKDVDPETGEETIKKEIVPIAGDCGNDPNTYSPYSKVYDDGCTGWTKDAESNRYFLITQQNAANRMLKERGHLFLNDVYEMLGIPKTKAGQVVGWIYDEKNPVGDNYIDFGLFDINREAVRDFTNGYERTIVLDFNVDGNIWEMM